MCGIAGIVNISDNEIKSKTVHDMCNNMVRRGPDYGNVKVTKNAVLGHRRLQILDLSEKGNQPMSSSDNRFSIVFNGEIYNHKELRNILEKDGFQFRTQTDTESLLFGYQKWGYDLPQYCRGMWSFVIWDNEKNILFGSRDRVGEKPFYYKKKGPHFSFASTLSGLKPSLDEYKISKSAVASLFSYEYIPHTECIYEGVQKLAPGHNFIFDVNGLNIQKYWELDYKSKIKISLNDSIDLVENTIENAVREQLIADVPVGIFLSGGVDSGLITALSTKYKPGLKTISLTVPGSEARDESKNAFLIAKKHKSEHIKVPIDQGCIKALPSILKDIEPLGDSSIIPVSFVSNHAAKHLKVVLTGDGGDEGFGGYGKALLGKRSEIFQKNSSFHFWRTFRLLFNFISRQRIMPIVRLLRLHSTGSKLLAVSGYEKYLETWDATPLPVRKLIYGESMKNMLKREQGEFIKKMYDDCSSKNIWDALLGVQVKTRLPNDFLFKVDSGTMFNSIEARSPLLDHRLLEITAKLPWKSLFSDEHDKSLLKLVASKYNPKKIVYGQKKGFSLPVESYFKKGWGKLLNILIEDGISADFGLINPNGVKKYLKKHGLRENYRLDRQLYSILTLEIWLRVAHEKTDDPNELGEKLFYYSK